MTLVRTPFADLPTALVTDLADAGLDPRAVYDSVVDAVDEDVPDVPVPRLHADDVRRVAVLPVDLNASTYRTGTEWVGRPGWATDDGVDDDLPEGSGIDARPMPFHPGQVPLGGPAPVSIHDDGDMAWHDKLFCHTRLPFQNDAAIKPP